ncbi:sulfite exporter TauE/SafE family protein [Cupriavidus basilensis]
MTVGVLFSVFTLALLGGVHCAAMCGGIALAAEQGGTARVPAIILRRPGHWLLELLVMHAGRLSMYALLGALLGTLGAGVWKAQYLPLQRWLLRDRQHDAGHVGDYGCCVGASWGLAGWSGSPRCGAGGLLRFLAAAGVRLAPLGLPQGRLLRRYGMGLAWGLVPCGMVYGALAMALLAGNAPSGSAGDGRVRAGHFAKPAGYLGACPATSGSVVACRPAVRTVAGLAVTAFGVVGVARAAALPETLAAHGFCLVF